MAYNELNQYNSPNYTAAASCPRIFGYARTIDGIVIHWWGDPNTNPSFMGVVNWLCRSGGQSSAHAISTGTGRQVAWIVNAGDASWHCGNAKGNASTIGIEADPRCRAEDYDVLAELIADIWIAYGRKLPLTPHRYWASTACPGNYDMNRITAEANAWFQKKTAPVSPVVPVTLPVPAAVKLPTPVTFKATKQPTNVWDLTTNPNYKSVKQLNAGDEFVAYGYINFNNSKYYVTEYSFNKGLKNGVNTVDLMEKVTVPPAPVTPPVQVTPEPPVTPKDDPIVPPVTEPPVTPPVVPPVIPPVEPPKESLLDWVKKIIKIVSDFLGSWQRK